MNRMLPVVLCGGSGTRLWPLSRAEAPKPFVPLIEGHSLMALTLQRCQALAPEAWCVAGESHRFMVTDSKSVAAQQLTLLLEPSARDTAAAVAWAVAYAQIQHPADTVLCFMPADHHVPDTQAFTEAVQTAVGHANATAIVLLGVKPNHPSTAYGYIRAQVPQSATVGAVQAFVEKPSTEVAAQLITDGQHWWNAGVFVGQVQAFAQALAEHAPDIWQAASAAADAARSESWSEGTRFVRPDAAQYAAIRKQSFDYAVAEKHSSMVMVPLRAAWTDMGSWQALAELQTADANNNRIQGSGYVQDGAHNYVHASSRPVVVVGLDHVHVVETPDAVLVARVDSDQALKQAVTALQSQGMPQVQQHRAVHRPWGWYDSVDQGEGFQVKRIVVKPGGVLSLQRHQHRAEHWVVVQGRAQVTRGDEVMELVANTSTFIPQGEVHRLENTGSEALVLIEVQTGSYLGEDDIERLEDVYGRR
jgi:mannose-1-phosphate guanylyltransferase/mannose-6-phosphate isomerase